MKSLASFRYKIYQLAKDKYHACFLTIDVYLSYNGRVCKVGINQNSSSFNFFDFWIRLNATPRADSEYVYHIQKKKKINIKNLKIL